MSRRNRSSRDELFIGERINPHRLYRSNRRVLAGVASGIAEYLGLSVTGTRIAVFFHHQFGRDGRIPVGAARASHLE